MSPDEQATCHGWGRLVALDVMAGNVVDDAPATGHLLAGGMTVQEAGRDRSSARVASISGLFSAPMRRCTLNRRGPVPDLALNARPRCICPVERPRPVICAHGAQQPERRSGQGNLADRRGPRLGRRDAIPAGAPTAKLRVSGCLANHVGGPGPGLRDLAAGA
jgi:hypothetical protein